MPRPWHCGYTEYMTTASSPPCTAHEMSPSSAPPAPVAIRLSQASTSKVRPKTSISVSPHARSQISSMAWRSASVASRTVNLTFLLRGWCSAHVTLMRASASGSSRPSTGQR